MTTAAAPNPVFSEEHYLAAYPDVATAVEHGQFVSGWQHYDLYGRREGRRPVADAPVELRDAVIVTKPDELVRRLGRETLLVTGSSRGGTSLVAYVLLRLGYPLIADKKLTHEATEAVAASRDVGSMSAFVTRMDANHRRWGFKLPAAALTLDWYLANLRDPVVVLVFRNPMAIARTIVSRDRTWGKSEDALLDALSHGMTHMQAAAKAIRSAVPTILVDVDLAARSPQTFVADLVSTLGLAPDAETSADIASQIAVPGYKKL